MKETNTSPREIAKGKDNRKLLPIMCLQVVLLGVLSVWGLWIFVGAAMEGTTIDEPFYYIVLSGSVFVLLVVLIVAMFLATPKGSNIRRGFLTFVVAVGCIVVGFAALSFLVVYAFKTLLHGVRWL